MHALFYFALGFIIGFFIHWYITDSKKVVIRLKKGNKNNQKAYKKALQRGLK